MGGQGSFGGACDCRFRCGDVCPVCLVRSADIDVFLLTDACASLDEPGAVFGTGGLSHDCRLDILSASHSLRLVCDDNILA